MYTFKSHGVLRYSPTTTDGKNRASSHGDPKWWVILDCCPELIAYYRSLVLKLHGIKLQKPLWGPHISVVRGDNPPNKEVWAKHTGKVIEFEYESWIVDNGKHWWLEVECPELVALRLELGLPPKPDFDFHITLGARCY